MAPSEANRTTERLIYFSDPGGFPLYASQKTPVLAGGPIPSWVGVTELLTAKHRFSKG